MIRIQYLLKSLLAALAIGIVGLSAADLANANEPPSDGAMSIPGAKGRIVYTPKGWKGKGHTTYWIDTDGIDPGTAGCHVEVNSEGKVFKGNRVFGEACQPNGRLVESNPGRQDVHAHKDDLGHPDTFDCAVWCREVKGASGGACRTVAAPGLCGNRGVKSAKCVCSK